MENAEIRTMEPFAATQFIEKEMRNAYYLKSRSVPDNLGQMATTLKDMLLKYMPRVTTRDVGEGIEKFILHEQTAAISVDMLFKAVKQRHQPPYEARSFDTEGYCRPDTEADCRTLLDTLAARIANGQTVYFDPRREYGYLVMRGQLGAGSYLDFIGDAKLDINNRRTDDGVRRIDWAVVGKTNELDAVAMELAVTDWLRKCNDSSIAPSSILAPLANDGQWRQFRKSM